MGVQTETQPREREKETDLVKRKEMCYNNCNRQWTVYVLVVFGFFLLGILSGVHPTMLSAMQSKAMQTTQTVYFALSGVGALIGTAYYSIQKMSSSARACEIRSSAEELCTGGKSCECGCRDDTRRRLVLERFLESSARIKIQLETSK